MIHSRVAAMSETPTPTALDWISEQCDVQAVEKYDDMPFAELTRLLKVTETNIAALQAIRDKIKAAIAGQVDDQETKARAALASIQAIRASVAPPAIEPKRATRISWADMCDPTPAESVGCAVASAKQLDAPRSAPKPTLARAPTCRASFSIEIEQTDHNGIRACAFVDGKMRAEVCGTIVISDEPGPVPCHWIELNEICREKNSCAYGGHTHLPLHVSRGAFVNSVHAFLYNHEHTPTRGQGVHSDGKVRRPTLRATIHILRLAYPNTSIFTDETFSQITPDRDVFGGVISLFGDGRPRLRRSGDDKPRDVKQVAATIFQRLRLHFV